MGNKQKVSSPEPPTAPSETEHTSVEKAAHVSVCMMEQKRKGPFEFVWLRESPLPAVAASEFIGTFFLCFTVTLVEAVAPLQVVCPLAIAAAIIALCGVCGESSGAHFNPCITLSCYLTDRRFSFIRTCVYIAAELLGAIAGSSTAAFISSKDRIANPYHVQAYLDQSYTVTQIVLCEVFFTCLLSLTVLKAGFQQTQPNSLCPIWVAAAVSKPYGQNASKYT